MFNNGKVYNKYKSIIILIVAAILLSSMNSFAQDSKKIVFDIQSQKIGSALIKFADQTDLSLIYNLEDFGSIQANAVQGQYTPLEALNIMLMDTGLIFEETSKETIAIKKKTDMPTGTSEILPKKPIQDATKKEKSDHTVQKDTEKQQAVVQIQNDSDSDYRFEEIIVTATKRAERLQDVAQSITAVSADDLKFMGANNFSDIVESIPGVEYKSWSKGFGSVTIRGIAEQSEVSGGPGASVGNYLDEIPLTMAEYFPDIASSDMARVEVLRGPQGTLYGEGFPGRNYSDDF